MNVRGGTGVAAEQVRECGAPVLGGADFLDQSEPLQRPQVAAQHGYADTGGSAELLLRQRPAASWSGILNRTADAMSWVTIWLSRRAARCPARLRSDSTVAGPSLEDPGERPVSSADEHG